MMKKVSAALMILAMLLGVLGACAPVAQKSSDPPATAAVDPTTSDAVQSAAPAGTFRIGFTGSITGNTAALGADARDALLLWVKTHNNMMGNYTIETFIEDDSDNAQTTLNKVTKLKEVDNVDIVICPQNNGGAAAIRQYCIDQNLPNIMYYSPLDAITKEEASPMVALRTGFSSSQGAHPFGEWAYDQGYRRAAIMTYDFTLGHELAGGFHRVFEEAGGTVVSRQFTPIGTQDWGPMISNIDYEDIDVLVWHASGADAVRVSQQLVDAGVHKKVDIITLFNATDEVLIGELPMALAETNYYSCQPYCINQENPENTEFLEAFRAAYNHDPSNHAENVWTAMEMLNVAVETGVDVTDGTALVKAVRAVKDVKTPRGTVKGVDEFGQIITPVVIRKLEVVDGRLQNMPVAVYEDVSQFWTWTPEEFMAMPKYDRDNPALTGT